VQSPLIDGAQSFYRNFQRNPFILFGQIKTLGLQVGKKPAFGLHIGVRNLMACHRNLACNLTYSCHDLKFKDGKGAEKPPNNQRVRKVFQLKFPQKWITHLWNLQFLEIIPLGINFKILNEGQR
jgi:hypothetical protein